MNQEKEPIGSQPSAEITEQLTLPHIETVKQAVSDLSDPDASLARFLEEGRKYPKKRVAAELEPALADYFFTHSRTDIPEDQRRSILARFERAILEMMKDSADALFGMGAEGKVYRFVYGNREFVVVKKRYDSPAVGDMNDGTKREYEFHRLAKMSTRSSHDVYVPEIYAHVTDSDSKAEYMVMEHIEGKSMQTLTLEQVLNFEYLPILRTFLRSEHTEPPIKKRIERFLAKAVGPLVNVPLPHGTWLVEGFYPSRMQMEIQLTDTNAPAVFIEAAVLLKDLGCLGQDEFPNRSEINKKTQRIENQFMFKTVSRSSNWYPLFDFEKAEDAKRAMETFLAMLHRARAYHNDGHFGNVMVGNSITMIDFGHATETVPQDNDAYIPDTSFVEMLRSTFGTKKSHAESDRRKENFRLFETILPIARKHGVSPNALMEWMRETDDPMDYAEMREYVIANIAKERRSPAIYRELILDAAIPEGGVEHPRVAQGKIYALLQFAKMSGKDRKRLRSEIAGMEYGALKSRYPTMGNPRRFELYRSTLLDMLDAFD